MAADHTFGLRQTLLLPPMRKAHWSEAVADQLRQLRPGSLELICHEWPLACRDLTALVELLGASNFSVGAVQTTEPTTAIAAQALGLTVQLIESNETTNKVLSPDVVVEDTPRLRLHRGTLRSGDHLQTQGDLLVLGDVNPGARVSASGDVMVWGRLRGIAHAGQDGDRAARIIALQLRPLQLRIADRVARGPDDDPLPGLTEEAHIETDEIVIQPASPRLNARLMAASNSHHQDQSLA